MTLTDPLLSLAQQLGVEVVGCGHDQRDEYGRCETVAWACSGDSGHLSVCGGTCGVLEYETFDCPGYNEEATADAVREKVMGLVEAAALEPAHTVVGDFSMMRVPRAQLRALAESLSTFPKEQP